jgi:hypothetical protein
MQLTFHHFFLPDFSQRKYFTLRQVKTPEHMSRTDYKVYDIMEIGNGKTTPWRGTDHQL